MSIKLLLIESVTAGAFDRPLQNGLLEEAELMLGAMVAETAMATRAPQAGLVPKVLRRVNLPARWPDITLPVAPGAWPSAWQRALRESDAVWLLAPETGGELEALSRAVELAGVRLLGCAADAVAVAASKRATHAALAGRVRQPDDVGTAAGWVIKPDDGVAAEGVRRLAVAPRSETPLAGHTGVPPTGSGLLTVPEEELAQPYVEGEPLSLCVLSDGHDVRVLSVNRQYIEWDVGGSAHYRGGVTNAIPDRARFATLAQAVQRAIPGLWGCWGIDCVLPADGEPVLIEVNPRFTTAFAHLRAATGFDLLGSLLDLAAGGALPDAAAGRPVAFVVPDTVAVTA